MQGSVAARSNLFTAVGVMDACAGHIILPHYTLEVQDDPKDKKFLLKLVSKAGQTERARCQYHTFRSRV